MIGAIFMKFGLAPTTLVIFMIKFPSHCIPKSLQMPSFGCTTGTEIRMLKLAFEAILLVTQLSGPGGALPQILHPDFNSALKVGQRGEITVSFTAVKGYAVDRTLP